MRKLRKLSKLRKLRKLRKHYRKVGSTYWAKFALWFEGQAIGDGSLSAVYLPPGGAKVTKWENKENLQVKRMGTSLWKC